MTQRRPHAARWDRDPPHQLHTSSAGMGVHMTTCPKYSGRARRTAGAQCRGVHTMPVPPCGPTERPGGAAPPLLLLPLRHPPRPPPLPRPPLRCIAPQPHAAAAACSAPACALVVRLPFAPGTRGCACGRRAILRSGCGVAEVAPGRGSERACSPVQLLQSPRSPCRYPEHAGRARRCLHPCLSPARPARHSPLFKPCEKKN